MGLIPFGKVLNVHGLSGGIKIVPFSKEFHNFFSIQRVFIDSVLNESPIEFRILRRRFHKNYAIVELKGIKSRADAGRLKGCIVMVNTSDLLDTDNDEYYWFQLIGLRVFTINGEYVGRVENLMDRAQQSLIIVSNGKKEFLIPLVDYFIKEINLEDSLIVISPVTGLLD